jgi:hypothetical protein
MGLGAAAKRRARNANDVGVCMGYPSAHGVVFDEASVSLCLDAIQSSAPPQ